MSSLNQTLSEEEFVNACREFYMHLHNWNLLEYAGNENKLVNELPSPEKVRAKLDKEFDPKKGFEPYTQFFTQEQIEKTGCSWIPYACYLADESSFTRVIAHGSWSADPLHEIEIDIGKVRLDFPEPIAQYLVGFNIAKSNLSFKPGYGRVGCGFARFINRLDLAIQMYKFMTNLDPYAIRSDNYVQIYGQEFMAQVESKLSFSLYSEEKAARDQRRKEEDEARNAKWEQEEKARKEAGILTQNEINSELSKIAGQMQNLGSQMSKCKIDYLESQLKIYKAGSNDLVDHTKLQDLEKEYKAKISEYATEFKTISNRSESLAKMQAANSANLANSLKGIVEAFGNLASVLDKDKNDGLYDTDPASSACL